MGLVVVGGASPVGLAVVLFVGSFFPLNSPFARRIAGCGCCCLLLQNMPIARRASRLGVAVLLFPLSLQPRSYTVPCLAGGMLAGIISCTQPPIGYQAKS